MTADTKSPTPPLDSPDAVPNPDLAKVETTRIALAKALSDIDSLSGKLAVQVLNRKEAIHEERELKARFLDGAIEVAMEALGIGNVSLHLLCGRIWKTGDTPAMIGGKKPQQELTHHRVQGLLLFRGGPLKLASPTIEHGGTYGGRDVLLLATGKLAYVVYSGTWSEIPGATDHWETEIEPTTALEIAHAGPRPETQYDIRGMVEKLFDAMQSQLSGSVQAAGRVVKEQNRYEFAIKGMQHLLIGLRRG